MVQWLLLLAYRHIAGLARLAASLLVASIVLLVITEGLLNDAETAVLGGPCNSAIVILAMARATGNAVRVLTSFGLVVCIVGTVILFSRSRLEGGTKALSFTTEGMSTFASNLDALVSQLAELESTYARTQEALAQTVEERAKQDELISLTRSQAEVMRAEIRTAASSGAKVQTALAVLGILLAIVLAVIAS